MSTTEFCLYAGNGLRQVPRKFCKTGKGRHPHSLSTQTLRLAKDGVKRMPSPMAFFFSK